MKKFFQIAGVILVIFIIAVSGFFYTLKDQSKKLTRESEPFVEQFFAKVFTTWNYEEFNKISHEDLKESMTEEQVRALFKLCEGKLGPYEKILDIQGGGVVGHDWSFKNKTIGARHFIKAKFKNGEASINISLLKQHSTWYLTGFFINSSLLSP